MDAGGGESSVNVAGAIQGKVTGVIIPPPDIRAVVDKTASFVAKYGKTFEQKILNSEEGKTSKFNFMKPYDPYHAYYEQKIRLVLSSIVVVSFWRRHFFFQQIISYLLSFFCCF